MSRKNRKQRRSWTPQLWLPMRVLAREYPSMTKKKEEKKDEAPKGPVCCECRREPQIVTKLGDSVLCGSCARSYGDCSLCNSTGFALVAEKWQICPACDGDSPLHRYSTYQKGGYVDPSPSTQEQQADRSAALAAGYGEDWECGY